MTRFATNAAVTCAMVLAGFSTAARADEWNKKTNITISGPIEVSGTILPAGKYVLRTLDTGGTGASNHVVQVMNENESKVMTTVLAINNYRLRPTGKTVLSFYEMPAGQPEVLRAWFYPGDNFGQEFIYKKHRATEITTASRTAVPSANDDADMNNTTTQVATADNSAYMPPAANTDRTPAPAPVMAQNTTPDAPPAYAQSSSNDTSNSGSGSMNNGGMSSGSTRSRMPHTGSEIPAMALLGLASLASAFGVRKANRNN